MYNPLLYIFFPLIYWGGSLILSLVILKFILNYFKKQNKKQFNNIDYSTYYRDIPCFGNINLVYWLLYNFSNINKETLNNGLVGAYLLSWYQKGYIDILKSNDIDLKDGNWERDFCEDRLYQFLKEAARNNNILEKNEIKNYCAVNGRTIRIEILV